MASNSTPPAVNWAVVGQIEQTVFNAQNVPSEVMHITYQLADGTQGSVNVPLSQYNVDSVRAAIAAKATVQAAVGSLTGMADTS